MAPQAMDWITARNRKDKLVEMMKAGNWRGVLAEFSEDSYYREPLLVWIKPSSSCLEFIEAEVRQLGLSHLSSVGCGCGTLEWLLQASTGQRSKHNKINKSFLMIIHTGLTVTGYEVNRIWWEGEHSTPHFIKIGGYI